MTADRLFRPTLSTITESVREGLNELYSSQVETAPEVAINACPGVNGYVTEGHKNFVITRSNTLLFETDDYQEALMYPEAKPFGTSLPCSSCKQIGIEEVYPTPKRVEKYIRTSFTKSR